MDCHLPQGPIRDRFFQKIDQLGLNHLHAICLTHPHEDHYTGMEAVVDYFSTSGRSIGVFCDCGTEPREILTFLKRRNRPKNAIREYERLYLKVFGLIRSKAIDYIRADENTCSVLKAEGVDVLPVGPKPEIARLSVVDSTLSGKIRTDLNKLSVVLSLVVREADANFPFKALLAADTDADGFRAAVAKLNERFGQTFLFDFIKVAHHGSLHSHRGSNVCSLKTTSGEAVAAISCGCFDVLPDQKVLQEFLAAKWQVLLTSKLTSGPSLPMALFGQGNGVSKQCYDLSVRWSAAKGLSWSPPEAILRADELALYRTSMNP